jgi:hypothetical protein
MLAAIALFPEHALRRHARFKRRGIGPGDGQGFRAAEDVGVRLGDLEVGIMRSALQSAGVDICRPIGLAAGLA